MIRPYYQTPYLFRLKRSGELWTIGYYLATSAVVSAVDYGSFWLAYNQLQAGLLAATAIAYIAGLITSYLLSRYWVFKKSAGGMQFKTSALRYASLLFVNFLITFMLLWAMQEAIGLSPFIGKFVVWTFLIFWNYFAGKLWVFKGPRTIKKSLSF